MRIHVYISLLLLNITLPSMAQPFRCDLPGGKVEYQSQPCTQGKQSKVEIRGEAARATPTNGAGPKHVEPGKDFIPLQTVTISIVAPFPVKEVLLMTAQSAGQALVVDPKIEGVGTFYYSNVHWLAVVRDISARYGLVVKEVNGITTVSRP